MATRYVNRSDAAAADSNAGTSQALPRLTLHSVVDGDGVDESGGSGTGFTVNSAGDTAYVFNGTYTDVTAASGVIKYNPTNSGSSGLPNAYRVMPGHQVTVARQVNDDTNHPTFGTSSGEYIIWDGFILAPDCDARWDGGAESDPTRLAGLVFENIVQPEKGNRDIGTGNWTCIYSQTTDGGVIRGCTLNGAYENGNPGDENPSSIKMYNNRNLLIYNCTLQNSNVGISWKSSNHDCEAYYLYISNTRFASVHLEDANSEFGTEGAILRNSVLENGGNIGVHAVGGADCKDWRLHNLTIWAGTAATNPNTTSAADAGRSSIANTVGCTASLAGSEIPIGIWNCILIMNSGSASGGRGQVGQGTVSGIVSGSVINYNNFWGTGGAHFACQQNWNGTTTTSLATWQGFATNLDAASILTNPDFQGTGGTNLGPETYMLNSSSGCIGQGRVGGVSGGAVTTIGAYETGSEQIGVAGDIPSGNERIVLGVRT